MDGILNIGEAIRRGRRIKKLTQKELAKILGVSPALVSLWENQARIPSGDELIKIARYLDIVHLLFPDYQIHKRNKEVSVEQQQSLLIREEILQYRRETLAVKQSLQQLQEKVDKLFINSKI